MAKPQKLAVQAEGEERESLVRVFGRWEVLALAFGSMIGWSWVMVAHEWVILGGILGGILAFILAGVMCSLVGVTFAELSSALPVAGGGLIYPYRAIGYKASWFTGWATVFAHLAIVAFEGVAIAIAIDYLFNIPQVGYLWTIAGFDVYLSWAIIGIVVGLFLCVVNHFGAKPAGILQTWVTAFLALVGLSFVFGSSTGIAPGGSTQNIEILFTNWDGIAAILVMAPALYLGFDVVPLAAEEVNVPYNQVGKLLVFSIFLAAFWYIIIMVGVSLSGPLSFLEEAAIPVADGMGEVFNSVNAARLMICAGIAGIISSWNAFILGTTRVLFAMSRAKMLPPIFSKVDEKYKTPTYTLILIGVVSIIAPFLGENALIWFLNASALGTVLSYLMVAISHVVLKNKEPDLERPYNAPKILGILAVITSILFVFLYLPFGPGGLSVQEYLIIGIWTILGIILAIWNQKLHGDFPEEERQHLLYGDFASDEVKEFFEEA